MNMFNNNKEVWAAYNNAVVELSKVEDKLVKATAKYEMWLEKALACESNDDMWHITENEVCPAWEKVLKLKSKVEACTVTLGKIKARITWSDRLGGYKSKDDSYGFEMVKYN